ncbi:MAG: CsbD family protein [Terriglobales bacterium]
MSINKDQVKGRVEEAKGKLKEVTGKLVGNEKLQVKGKVQKFAGAAQAKFGDVKRDRVKVESGVRGWEGVRG